MVSDTQILSYCFLFLIHNYNSLQIFDVITYQYHPMERSHHVVLVEEEWVVRETLVVSHVTVVMS